MFLFRVPVNTAMRKGTSKKTLLISTPGQRTILRHRRRTLLLVLVLVVVWGLYATRILETIFTAKDSTLMQILTRRTAAQCKYDEMTSLIYDISPIKHRARQKLSEDEIEKVRQCSRTAEKQRKFGVNKTKIFKPQRWTSHTYLNNKSTVVELGGYLGNDVENIFSRYQPRRYIVVEPVYQFYKKLVHRFQNISNILIYNFGVGGHDENTSVYSRLDGTSSFKKKAGGHGIPIRLVGARNFFLGIGVGFFDIDLLTMNCEGCEYPVLDFLLDTNLINNIRNIQYQPHKLDEIDQSLYKYCEYQQRLRRTHSLVFRHQFWWESWTLREKYHK